MSAEAIHLVFTDLSNSPEQESRAVHPLQNNYNVSNNLPVQAVRQFYFAPELTAEQIAMEEYLLECD